MKTLTRAFGLLLAWSLFMSTAVDHVPAATVDRSILEAGEALTPGQELTSTDGRHTLTMQADGNLVLRSGDETAWESGTAVPGSTLRAQDDGNMVIRDPGGDPVWASGTAGVAPARLELHEDGIAQVHDGAGAVRWVAPAPVA